MPTPPLTASPRSFSGQQPEHSDDNGSSEASSPETGSRHPHFRRESLSMAGVRRSKTSAAPITSPRAIRGRRPSFTSLFSSSFGGSLGHSPSSGTHTSPFIRGPVVEEGISPTQSVFSGDQTPMWEGRPNPRRRRSSGVPNVHWLDGGNPNTGDEPGVDVRSSRDQEMYGHLKGPCKITVVDYSSDPDAEDMNVRVDFPGQKLEHWLDSPAGQRPTLDGKPHGVRWIHVTGLNWEVIKTLTLKYQLHPLAVEDALRSGKNPRSKVDYYRTHLYLQILVHHIHEPDRDALARAAEGMSEGETAAAYGSEVDEERVVVSPQPRWRWWKRQGQIRLPEGVDAVFSPSVDKDTDLPEKMMDDDKETHRLVIDQLSAAYMVPIRRGLISLFMLRDGTLITISAHPMRKAFEPIYKRLEDEHSLLRRSGDASMLAHAILDVTVDLDIEISQAFESEILKAESRVLVQAQLEFVRHLFIIQAQITRFRRQLTPLLYACYIMRDQDTTRASAAGALTLPRSARTGSTSTVTGTTPVVPAPTPVIPFTGGSPMGHMGGAQGGIHAAGGPNLGGLHGTHGIGAMGGAGMGGAAGPGMGSGGMGFVPPTSDLSSLPGATPEGIPWSPSPTPSNGRPSTSSSRAPTPTQSGIPLASNCPPAGPAAVTAFFSPLSRVYMNDVIDHLEMVVGSCEQFVNSSDHLTDYTFNVLSFQTNNSMERLSIVTIIFLPLTFISSYFGMNFTDFDALENSVLYFWKLAAPLTVAFFLIFSYEYIKHAGETLTRKMAKWRREKDVKQRRGSMKW